MQEVVDITASYRSFVCKYYKLYIQQISERSRLHSGRNGPECEAMYRFRYVFSIKYDGLTLLRLFPRLNKVQDVVKITSFRPPPPPHPTPTPTTPHPPPPSHHPPPPPPTPIRLLILKPIYTANGRTISPVFGPWWTRMWSNVPISLCISIKYDGLTLPRLLTRP